MAQYQLPQANRQPPPTFLSNSAKQPESRMASDLIGLPRKIHTMTTMPPASRSSMHAASTQVAFVPLNLSSFSSPNSRSLFHGSEYVLSHSIQHTQLKSGRNSQLVRSARVHTPVAQWQTSVFQPDPSVPSLASVQDNFPSNFHTAFLLGLDTTQQNAFITPHESTSGQRPAYSTTSLAFPLPLPTPPRQATLLIRDVFEYIYSTPNTASSQPFIPADTSFVTSLLPASLRRLLSIDHISANSIAAKILSEPTPLRNRAEVIRALLEAADARIQACAITELPSTTTDLLRVTGVLYVQRCVAKLYNDKVFSKAVPVVVDAHYAVVVANTIACPCFLQVDLFEDACVRIHDMPTTFASCGRHVVKITQAPALSSLTGPPAETDDTSCTSQNRSAPVEIWRMTASDILALSDEQLRSMLRSQDVAVLRNESRDSLLSKVVHFMDEVHRRELGIVLAAQQEMYGLAADLQKGRSRRGRMLTKLREAEQQGAWEDVVRYATEVKIMERQTHDITAEPGSYDPNLDQDDWYRPNR